VQVQHKISCVIFSFFFVAKPFRTRLFHERNSEPDRGGFLFICQDHCTNKNKFYQHWLHWRQKRKRKRERKKRSVVSGEKDDRQNLDDSSSINDVDSGPVLQISDAASHATSGNLCSDSDPGQRPKKRSPPKASEDKARRPQKKRSRGSSSSSPIPSEAAVKTFVQCQESMLQNSVSAQTFSAKFYPQMLDSFLPKMKFIY
jgi:hypothetical protein